MTLTEFLLARIAEDEQSWRTAYHPTNPMGIFLLAECKAKRRIVELHRSWPVLVETRPTFETADAGDLNAMTLRMSQQFAWATEQQYREHFGSEPPTGPILRILANVYNDHPDFDPSWAV